MTLKSLKPTRAGLAAVGVAGALVLVAGAAFFTVRALGESGCAEFGPGRTSVATNDGMAVSVSPDALRGSFGVKLSSVPLAQFNANASNTDMKAAFAALPTSAKPTSNLLQIQTCSADPKSVAIRVRAPLEAQSLDQFALLGFDQAAKRWRWLGAEQDLTTRSIVGRVTRVPNAVLLVEVPPAKTAINTELAATGTTIEATDLANVGEINPVGLYLGDNGQIVGDRSRMAAVAGLARVLPVLRNWSEKGEINRTMVKAMLGNDRSRDAHIANIVDLATRMGDYAGVEVDYRGVDPSQREAYAGFIAKLGDALRAKGKSLTVGIPAPQPTNSVDPETMFATPGFDIRSLAAAADSVKLDLSGDPNAFQRDNLDALVNWAQSRIGKDKLQFTVPALSVKQAADGSTQFISESEALEPLGKVVPEQAMSGPVLPGQKIRLKLNGMVNPADVQFDEATGTYRYAYTDADGQTQTVWLNTTSGLKRKLDLLSSYNVRGLTVRGLDAQADASTIAKTLGNLDQLAQANKATGALAWTVNGTPEANSNGAWFEWTAPNQPGKYVLGAGMTADNDRGTIQVEVVKPTPTPPPPTPTPVPVVRAAAPQPAAQPKAAAAPVAAPAPAVAAAPPAPAAPVSARGMAGFGLGGHIKSLNYLAQMRDIGMTWLKYQVVMPGGAPALGWLFDSAHAYGMKVLVGAVGDRGRASDTGYHKEFAQALANVAKQGADAIEIWNEPNLDREYGYGKVSAENYTNMLREAYTAIKAANPNTIVIGGANAPTGYFGGGCSANGCDDSYFLAKMGAAGAAQYMDCMGAHYNGSPNPPDLRSGGPTGNHYSWYFFGTLDTTFNALGGRVPICFTEMGYVTGEGIGPLPGGFSWGSGISLANQGDWLARAINLGRASGRVKLIIIWNIDFRQFDEDPQAGYSIFRPNGTCPACGPIKGAMGR